jgi:hypothetical protein
VRADECFTAANASRSPLRTPTTPLPGRTTVKTLFLAYTCVSCTSQLCQQSGAIQETRSCDCHHMRATELLFARVLPSLSWLTSICCKKMGTNPKESNCGAPTHAAGNECLLTSRNSVLSRSTGRKSPPSVARIIVCAVLRVDLRHDGNLGFASGLFKLSSQIPSTLPGHTAPKHGDRHSRFPFHV